MKIGSKEVLSAQVTDVVVLPEYRARGTLIKIVGGGIEECVKGGVDINYGFSIKLTYRIATKLLGFTGICPIFNMAKVLNPAPYLQQKVGFRLVTNSLGFAAKQVIKVVNKKKLAIPKELRIDELSHFDHRFDDFWYKEAENYQIALVRDSQYLNWRYINNPTQYKIFCVGENRSIKGFIVLKCSQEDVKRGRILEILVEWGNETIADLLLIKAINYFLDQKVDFVTCWMLEHSPIFQTLKKRRFVERETSTNLIARSYMPDYPNKYLIAQTKWYVTMGDSDYF